MEFVNLTEQDFNTFSRSFKNKCFMQSTNVAELRKRNGWDVDYVGVKKENEIIAATLLISRKRHLKKEFYAIRGPLVDFDNTEVLTFFIDNLKSYIKKNNGYMLRIDPYLEVISRDKDFNATEAFDYSYLKETLKKLGFKEENNTTQAKIMYVIDLKDSIDEVMKDMEPKTRQMIRKNEKMGIVIRKGTIEDIPLFEDIMEHTSERRHFLNRGENFYKNMYECYEKDNMISLVFAELDISLAKQNIERERKDIEIAKRKREENRKIGKCNEKKAQVQEKEENATLEKLVKKEEELNALEKEYGNRITLGGILYILYENEVASVYGGSYDKFKEYQPFYTIHYEMLKYAIENKYPRYNFYAICNTPDQNDPQYGIYLFKRGFGGHVMELIGEFILPIDKTVYQVSNILRKVKRGHS